MNCIIIIIISIYLHILVLDAYSANLIKMPFVGVIVVVNLWCNILMLCFETIKIFHQPLGIQPLPSPPKAVMKFHFSKRIAHSHAPTNEGGQ